MMNMPKLTFLGTGGGRIVTPSQGISTGGLVLEMDGVTFHIDPGPGALVRAKQFGVDLRKIDVILLSHTHIDHSNDCNAVIDCMTKGGIDHKGIIIGPEAALRGTDENSPVVLKFYLKALEKVICLKPGEEARVNTIKIKATPTVHSDKNAIGFVIKGSKQISYTSDGEYFPELAGFHKGSEILILNVLRPYGDEWKMHLNTRDAVNIIKEVKPKIAIFQHFGFKMINANPFNEAKRAEKESGCRVVAAEDGMVIDLEKYNVNALDKFVKK